MRTYPVLLLVCCLALACDGGSPTAPEDAAPAVATIVKTSYSGFAAAERTAAHGVAEWARLWETLHAGQEPKPALPAVDFTRETVVLGAAGTRANGCYSIEFTRVDATAGGSLLLEVTETEPGPACVCTEALTRPVHVVRIDRVAGAMSFVERSRELAC